MAGTVDTGQPPAFAGAPEKFASVAELIDFEDSLFFSATGNFLPVWAFRGQPKQFASLTPSFQRQFTRRSIRTAQLIESNLITAFRDHFSTLRDQNAEMPTLEQISEGFDLRCLSVMQHYEIPTRLLDWTTNFWIAVYFACASDPGETAELWYYDRRIFDIQRQSSPEFRTLIGEASARETPLIAIRDVKLIVELDPGITPRMKKQHAHHTVSNNVFADHAELLYDLHRNVIPQESGALGDTSIQGLQRVLIDGSCKGKALQHLAQNENITAGTIFPDVVGLGRFLRWQFESLRTMLL